MKRGVSIAVIAGLVALAAAALVYERRGAPPSAPAPAARQEPARERTAPSFDAVHIDKDGTAVIAGRAAPGAAVTVLDGAEAIGQATADARGEWVVITSRPLPPGPQALSLSALAPGEAEALASTVTLAVVVPPHGTAQPAIAVLLPKGQGPAHPLGGEEARAPHQVALDMVEYDAAGHTFLMGRADPRALLDILVDDGQLAIADADADGAWAAEISSGVPVGHYRLGVRAHARDGQDAGAMALDLYRAPPGSFGTSGYVAVLPGQDLWHMAQRLYGDGGRYLEIYRANQEHIDKSLKLEPGEFLVLPGQSQAESR
jgi:nucleoid-associated protein YgaU